jgi:N-acetyl-anhydromuramyl-L-alanine amidase AmpD
MTDAFIPAKHFYPGRKKKIRAVVIHCTASPDSSKGAEAVARYFQTTDRAASAHTVVDNDSTVNCVKEADTAWHAKGMNADGLGLEIVGQATQSRAQWLDPFSKAALDRAARKTAEWCKRYSIPPRYLTAAQIKDGVSKGITFHVDVDRALPSTGHTDPGVNFPRDHFLNRVKAFLAPAPAYRYTHLPLRKGDRNVDVAHVQKRLGITVDGIFYAETEGAVKDFQRRKGLLADGIVGKATAGALG